MYNVSSVLFFSSAITSYMEANCDGRFVTIKRNSMSFDYNLLGPVVQSPIRIILD